MANEVAKAIQRRNKEVEKGHKFYENIRKAKERKISTEEEISLLEAETTQQANQNALLALLIEHASLRLSNQRLKDEL